MISTALSHEIATIDRIAGKADYCLSQLKDALKGKMVTAKVQEHIDTYDDRYNDYVKALGSDDYDLVTKSASHLATYLSAICTGLGSSLSVDENSKELIKKLLDLSTVLKGSIEDNEVVFAESDRKGRESTSKVALLDTQILQKNIESFEGQLKDSEERHEKRQITLSIRLEDMESSLESIEEDMKSRLKAVDTLYLSAKEDLDKKQKGVDDLLGTISASVIAGDYDSSATSEKKMADCMVIIALAVGFSLYETTTDAFKWENSLFRLVFTILLSVPAAYLARESAKHRQQQYTHLQTSLDLKAITPYLASLPIEEQHRLKSEIANRLFAPKNYSLDSNDAYPINTQEILMKLLDKLEFKSSNKREGDTSKNG
jgi:hypothetical protein